MPCTIKMSSSSDCLGANCSSGRAITKVPERWSGNWADNLAPARMADDAGLDFLLPIGRWLGYGGETNYQGETYETITWATGETAIRTSGSLRFGLEMKNGGSCTRKPPFGQTARGWRQTVRLGLLGMQVLCQPSSFIVFQQVRQFFLLSKMRL